jgi:hypothetical protein
MENFSFYEEAKKYLEFGKEICEMNRNGCGFAVVNVNWIQLEQKASLIYEVYIEVSGNC